MAYGLLSKSHKKLPPKQVKSNNTIALTGRSVRYGTLDNLFNNNSTVNNINAEKLVPIVHACINKIASTVAAEPWKFYVKVEEGEDILLDETDTIYNYVLNYPNPDISGMDFKFLLVKWLLTTGHAAFYIHRDNEGLPYELDIINPEYLKTTYNSFGRINGYDYRIGGKSQLLRKEDVVLFKIPDLFGGPSTALDALRASLAIYKESKLFQEEFFLNGAAPRFYIKTEMGMSEEETREIVEIFESNHKKGNRHRTAIGDAEITKISDSLKDLDITLLNDDLTREVISIFGVPEVVLGLSKGSNRATVKMEEYAYQRYTITPILTKLDNYINNFYLPDTIDGLVIYSKHDNVIQDDNIENIPYLVKAVGKPFITRDEARRMIGLKEVEDDSEFYDDPSGGGIS